MHYIIYCKGSEARPRAPASPPPNDPLMKIFTRSGCRFFPRHIDHTCIILSYLILSICIHTIHTCIMYRSNPSWSGLPPQALSGRRIFANPPSGVGRLPERRIRSKRYTIV